MKRFTYAFAGALIIFLVAALLAVCAVSLTGCTSVDEGRVVNKAYSPAYSSIVLIPMCNGKTTSLIPMSQHHSERWSITVQNDAGDSETWSVAEAVYEQVQVGDAVRRATDGKITITTGGASHG